MGTSFYSSRSLNVETYTSRTAPEDILAGDIDFYIKLAERSHGEVLELGCGTGRILLELAAAGYEVTGLDLSPWMLEAAASARDARPADVAGRVTLTEGNMSEFRFEKRFGLIFVAFRSFMLLTQPAEQRRCLELIREHLSPGGVLALNLFDPQVDLLVPGEVQGAAHLVDEVIHPTSVNAVRIEVLSRVNDPLHQVFEETWRFTELDARGAAVRQEDEVLRMRWTYRYEMRYLFELCGFEILNEYSDYRLASPAYAREQIWVVRKPVQDRA